MLKFIRELLAPRPPARKPAPGKGVAKTKTATAGKAVAKRPAPANEREARIQAMQSRAVDVVTPERAELIRRAMEVFRAKQTVLADLGDEQRAQLVAVAMKKLLNEGKDEKK